MSSSPRSRLGHQDTTGMKGEMLTHPDSRSRNCKQYQEEYFHNHYNFTNSRTVIKSGVLILLYEQTLTAGHIRGQYNSPFYVNVCMFFLKARELVGEFEEQF